MYLLDTMVLSELRRRNRDSGVVEWIAGQRGSDLFLSAITIGEIERGIDLQRAKNREFAQTLAAWLDKVLTLYSDRVLPMDTNTARRWGRLSAALGDDSADLIIAATALEHGLTVVSRNVRHFEPAGLAVLNPFRNPG